jgi:serine/threonine-protein kinase
MAAPTLVCSSCHTPLPESAAYCWVCGTPTPTGTSEAGGSATRPSLQSAQAVLDTRRRLERALGSQFTVGDLVGRGGFAEVFAVRDQRLKRDLAVKVLSPELVVNQAMLTRFRREAEAIAALRHHGIVPIYDIGESGGIAYIMMPLIKGETLKKRIETEGRLAVEEAKRILVEVCDALRVAHEAGLVHRDIKPENVMLEGPRRQVLVMDFGIAKAIDPDATGMTTSGLIVGTPHYMSPEQASGEPVDARSDQYSLAVMGYRMVTGSHPFEAETTRALLYKQVFEAPPPAAERRPEIPPALSLALSRGMSKDAKDRFLTIQDFAAAVASEEVPAGDATAAAAPAAVPALEPTRAVVAAKKPPKAATPARPKAAPPARPKWLGPALIGSIVVLASIAVVSVVQRASPPAAGPAAQQGRPTPQPAGETTPPPEGAAPASGAGLRTAEGSGGAGARPETPRRAPRAAAPATCAEAVSRSQWSAAASLCKTEADAGRTEAQMAMARMLERGEGVPADPAAASSYYDLAAQGGSAEAAFQLARMLAEGSGIPPDLGRAGQLFLQAARRGQVPAMRATAEAYEAGRGLPRNEREAVNWYRRAAAAGDAPAQVRLGDLFFNGRGVSKNEQEAARWYTRAAEVGNAEGQYALGLAYLSGRGVERSDSLGLSWLEKAARQGHARASEELAKRKPS